VSIPRDDTDLIITEHGVADLRGASLEGRAKALIAIAAPEHREGLERGWAELRKGL
jgi:acyl-CoA hydrolase